MTRTRAVVATIAVFVTMALLFPVTSAGAGVNLSLTGEETCDQVSGQYEVVFTTLNPSDINEASIVVDTFQVDGVETPLVFAPDPMPAAGSATATATVPGDTTAIYLDLTISFLDFDFEIDLEMALDGDCTPTPTTTVEASTTAPVTPPPAAVALARQPTFTG
jgi:hypothetical protein